MVAKFTMDSLNVGGAGFRKIASILRESGEALSAEDVVALNTAGSYLPLLVASPTELPIAFGSTPLTVISQVYCLRLNTSCYLHHDVSRRCLYRCCCHCSQWSRNPPRSRRFDQPHPGYLFATSSNRCDPMLFGEHRVPE